MLFELAAEKPPLPEFELAEGIRRDLLALFENLAVILEPDERALAEPALAAEGAGRPGRDNAALWGRSSSSSWDSEL